MNQNLKKNLKMRNTHQKQIRSKIKEKNRLQKNLLVKLILIKLMKQKMKISSSLLSRKTGPDPLVLIRKKTRILKKVNKISFKEIKISCKDSVRKMTKILAKLVKSKLKTVKVKIHKV